MVELIVGDLYDQFANGQGKAEIRPEAVYECKFCPMYKISGASLRDSDRGRSHATAHRIAFEALLEPSPVLICPICDLPQKTSDIACIFGCMFNDLDLVEHLENDHIDILADDMVCDFSDSRYLLTTFQEQRLSNISRRSSGNVASVHGGSGDDVTVVDLSADDDRGASEGEQFADRRSESDHKFSIYGASTADHIHHETSQESTCGGPANGDLIVDDEPSEDDEVQTAVEHETVQESTADDRASVEECSSNLLNEVAVNAESNTILCQQRLSEVISRHKQMNGVSIITCLVCAWTPSVVSNSNRMRDEISAHVRFHIREESTKLPSESSSFFADKRLLNCMDFSLEEYFEKSYLSDLSGTINSQIMGRIYSDLLAKLFGICVPLVYRILHGNNGNPFRPSEVARSKVKRARPYFTLKTSQGKSSRSKRIFCNSTDTTESSDADSSNQECSGIRISVNPESDQHIQCARAECGHSLLILADRMAIVRHIAAHIRHDEMRLLNRTVSSAVVACDCGMAIVETAIESVLAVRVDFRATKWTLWCAYFCLENDEGDENLFTDSTDLNERWLKLWEDLIDEYATGKSMSLGNTIKLFEMHPFVDEQHQQTRKHKSVSILDSDAFYRSLSLVWRRLNRWSNNPIHRRQLSSESRWIRLAEIRRKVLLESKKADLHGDIWSGITAEVKLSAQRFQGSEISSITRDNEGSTHPADNEETTTPSEFSEKAMCCSICTNICIDAMDTSAIKDHCAFHAVMEGRMLCSLYIHRTADRPQICPFCHTEINVYKPMVFLHHLQCYHLEKARIIYDRYLFHYFPQSKIFCEPSSPLGASKNVSFCNSDFRICCDRHSCCGVNSVVTLPNEKTVTLSDIDIAIVKHILWHVRNDAFLNLDAAERDLLTRALMVRLSSSQMRQVLFMAKRVTKQLNRYKEPDVVKYIKEKMDEIGWILFGVNKGLVFQMVFTRRFVRDQSGMQIYPPCICRICVDKGLPRFSSDRRKRAFVAYAHPVVLHVLEHLSARQLSKEITTEAENTRQNITCRMDGIRFKTAPLAIKHILDAHNELVELSALDMVLEDMGLFEIFRNALSTVLGEQAWQLEEVLGFGAYTMKPCPKPSFLNEETSGAHRQDCDRSCDSSVCTCIEASSSQGETANVVIDQSPQYSKSRIRLVSLHGMPEASAACYEEFLHDPELHDNEEASSIIAIAGERSSQEAAPHASSVSPSNAIASVPLVPPLSIKQEVCEQQSDFDNRIAENSNGTSLTENFSNNDFVLSRDKAVQPRKKKVSKRIKQKRLKEVKCEFDECVPPQHNKALPLKNVIQGSKTVAAALAAALGSASTSVGSPFQRGGTRDAKIRKDRLSTTQPKPSDARSYSNRRKSANDAAEIIEEVDLELGNVSKKARLLLNENNTAGATEKKQSAQSHLPKRIRADPVRGKTISSDI
ncbi:hypothetical protein DICVIV_03159 [Dictyocaulus viviparus]|uniref:Uncharacterized protein n=1 Tax=Dictyocaulus viviparus TaxID=29172 RepID=A0A0D8Y1K9_DICVI|nr:hypothetical protein DICVIV_03159 [Dictyocaulus viviparus]